MAVPPESVLLRRGLVLAQGASVDLLADLKPAPGRTLEHLQVWADSPNLKTTMARDKRNHARENDVLVDDQDRHRHLWEEIGGVFIHHKYARQSIEELRQYFPL